LRSSPLNHLRTTVVVVHCLFNAVFIHLQIVLTTLTTFTVAIITITTTPSICTIYDNDPGVVVWTRCTGEHETRREQRTKDEGQGEEEGVQPRAHTSHPVANYAEAPEPEPEPETETVPETEPE
jgi:hypothetical protein